MTPKQQINQIIQNEEAQNADGAGFDELTDRLANYYLALYPDLTGLIIREIQQADLF